jgi:leucyl/phenylalanyl-tRNA--protein transferase
MIDAYCRLYESGFAHSVEAWQNGVLVGGLYGVSLGKCFFGESMYAAVSNASKVAFAELVNFLKSHAFHMIDCQVTTGHLISLGAREIPRDRFLTLLKTSLKEPVMKGTWQYRTG